MPEEESGGRYETGKGCSGVETVETEITRRGFV